ncbi:MAG: sugar ABC transporter permease [Planctomycetota bacterium]
MAEVAPNKGAGRSVATGLAFLLPNILGFLTFTAVPLVISLYFAFTNWDLTLHNEYRDEAVRFTGLENFKKLIFGAVSGEGSTLAWYQTEFWRYFGNTLFFMISIPFGIALSLMAALLLSQDLRRGKTGERAGGTMMLGISFGLVGAAIALSAVAWINGGGSWGMAALFVAVTALVLFGGVTGGQSVYRTLFYLPHFTSGVATFILWKKLFNTQQGPLTLSLQPVLASVEGAADWLPPGVVRGLSVLLIAASAGIMWFGLKRMRTAFREGDLGSTATFIPFVIMLLPTTLAFVWYGVADRPEGGIEAPGVLLSTLGGYLLVAAGVAGLWTIISFFRGQELYSRPMEGFASMLMFAFALMIAQLALIGIAAVVAGLPESAASSTGLAPPNWLNDPRWVKPSLMLVGLWGAIGSNTMLLYLAALTNVPGELYEAADIDGATKFQRFWNVTWPQLAPTTFFVVVMAVIGGLQGGFEMVRTMTDPPGGPGGASTTLAFNVYLEGFEVGRIGYASAVAWAMFLFILTVTLFNWTFGNKYVND